MPSRHRKQFALFVAAIVVPCLVLVGLSLRLARQDRELEAKRRDDERARLVGAFRDGLLVVLDAIRAGETVVPLEPGQAYRHPEVVLVAWLEGGKLILPWEADQALHRSQAAVAAIGLPLRRCEDLEIAPARAGAAAACYLQLLPALRSPLQVAWVRLQAADALQAAGRREEASALYRLVAEAGPAATDQDGVPLALLAAQRLPAADPRTEAAARAALASRPWTDPLGCELLREIAARANAPEDLRAAVADRIHIVKQAQALQDDAERLGLGRRHDGSWTAYSEDWLVGMGRNGGPRSPVLVVRTAAAAKPVENRWGIRIVSTREAGSVPAGDPFPGLRLSVPPMPSAGSRVVERQLYGFVLLLVVSATAFAGWLLWRDMRRELRLADMRAQFVASVSHELKTPLTSIRMFAETLQLKRSRDPETEAEYLETIVAECERLSRLVDGVLLFAKIEQGKKTYHFRPVHLENVVRAALRAMQYPLDCQGFQLRTRVDDSLPPVKGDADALEQAVLNLLGNAVKYSGDSREIELELARADREALIRVTDYGVGIAPELQDRIFEKFYRAPTRENERTPGTGLGLTLVSQIAKAHGGRVEVRSAPGKGSTFVLHIPLEVKT